MKTLAASVPMVVMPHGRDQKDNGVRVRAHGAGLVLPRHAFSRRIATAVQRVLDDNSFTENARRLGAVVYRDVRTDDLVTALEDLPRHARHHQGRSAQTRHRRRRTGMGAHAPLSIRGLSETIRARLSKRPDGHGLSDVGSRDLPHKPILRRRASRATILRRRASRATMSRRTWRRCCGLAC
jgi:hypothetical protein